MYLLHTHCLDDVDKINGTEFEYWCADLLRKLGYKQVTVTQESGDQRVDITALKMMCVTVFNAKVTQTIK